MEEKYTREIRVERQSHSQGKIPLKMAHSRPRGAAKHINHRQPFASHPITLWCDVDIISGNQKLREREGEREEERKRKRERWREGERERERERESDRDIDLKKEGEQERVGLC